MGSGGFHLGKSGRGREVNHSPSSGAEIMNDRGCTSAPFTFLHGVKDEKFTFFTLI
jgi:hypothetical protein